MIGRLLRWLARDEKGEVPALAPPAPAHDLTGTLVRCIADGWYNAPRGAPVKDQLCKVMNARLKPLPNGQGELLMVTLDGIPGEYAAMGFTKAETAIEPALPEFAAELRSISDRVKARQGGAV